MFIRGCLISSFVAKLSVRIGLLSKPGSKSLAVNTSWFSLEPKAISGLVVVLPVYDADTEGKYTAFACVKFALASSTFCSSILIIFPFSSTAWSKSDLDKDRVSCAKMIEPANNKNRILNKFFTTFNFKAKISRK